MIFSKLALFRKIWWGGVTLKPKLTTPEGFWGFKPKKKLQNNSTYRSFIGQKFCSKIRNTNLEFLSDTFGP